MFFFLFIGPNLVVAVTVCIPHDVLGPQCYTVTINTPLITQRSRVKWHRDDRSVRSCTRVVFWLVRRRSRTCLLTPPRYVRTISHATLFKERETQTGVGRRWGGKGYNREESRYPTTMLNLSKTPLITAPSILPILFLSLSLYSFSSAASVCSSTPAPPPPPSPASLPSLPLQLTTCKK